MQLTPSLEEILGTNAAAPGPATADPGLALYPHQGPGAEWLAARKRAVLNDPMGVGKTVTTIHGARLCGVTRAVVVVPLAVLWNWAREISVWHPNARVEVVESSAKRRVAAIEALVAADADAADAADAAADAPSPSADAPSPSADAPSPSADAPVFVVTTHGLLLSPVFNALMRVRWDLCVVDEAHCFRSPGAQRTKRLYGLRKNARSLVSVCARVWLLSGTMAVNHAGDLWTHLAGLWPERIEDEHATAVLRMRDPGTTKRAAMSHMRFLNTFCEMRSNGFADVPVGNNRAALPKLREVLDGIVLRRRKEDVLRDLPVVRTETVAVRAARPVQELTQLAEVLAPAAAEILARLNGEAAEAQRSMSVPQMFRALGLETEFAMFRRFCAIAKAQPVADILRDELESGELRKVLVFAHHTDAIRLTCEALQEFGAVTITGQTPAAARTRIVERFQTEDECRVLCGQIVAAGVGLTLTSASEVVFLELSPVPGDNDQAVGRVHRIGQKASHVRARMFTLDGTPDARIMEILRRKNTALRELTALAVSAS